MRPSITGRVLDYACAFAGQMQTMIGHMTMDVDRSGMLDGTCFRARLAVHNCGQ